MTLLERIDQDYKTAFKAGQQEVVNTLRLLKSEMKNVEIATHKTLEDSQVLDVVLRSVKRHHDSIEQFQKGNRPELAAKEQAELKVLEQYLPAQLSDTAVAEIISLAIAQTGASGPKETGKVMASVMAKVRGQADGNKVKALVSAALNKPTTEDL